MKAVKRILGLVSIVGLLGLLVGLVPGLALAAPVTPHGGAAVAPSGTPNGAMRRRDVATNGPLSGPLIYQGGFIQVGTVHNYALYWSYPCIVNCTYRNGITSYFQNVAADSHHATNVYYNNTQYYEQKLGFTLHADYSQQLGGTWEDSAFPPSGCSDKGGGNGRCFTQAQIQDEITRAIQVHGWPNTGISNVFFVFLQSGDSTCLPDNTCYRTSGWCAYHAFFTLNGQTVLYAVMPYLGSDLGGCGGGQSPNDPALDATLGAVSHEAIETITDPTGTGWKDAAHQEIADKCVFNYGAPWGGTPGHYYNQEINGAHYYLQQEWSNQANGCVQIGP